MPQDLFTIKRTADFLSKTVVGSKINKIFQPSSDEINLLLYNKQAFRLVVSTNARFARVSISSVEKPNPEVAYNFCMLLRKHLTGAEITSLDICNDDRIVKISIVNKNELQDKESYALYAEIMGKYSNLFLTKNGVILGAIKQNLDGLDGKRITLTGAKYLPPIKQDKISAFSSGAKAVFDNFVGGALDLYILKSFNDFSPVTAREISYRIENLGAYDGNKAYLVFLDFINQKTTPTVIDDGIKLDFYPFNYLSVLGKRSTYLDMPSAIESVFSSAENQNLLNKLKSGTMSAVLSHEKRLSKRICNLEERILESNDYKEYKMLGELITSQMYLIKKGQERVKLSNYFDGGEIDVLLDSTLTPQQNAQRYYKLYRKKKATATISTEQIKSAKEELNYVLSIKFYLSQAENKQDIEDIKRELIDFGIIKERQNKKGKVKKPTFSFRKYEYLGYTATLGKNNLQNDKLLSLADKTDIWLHVKNYHSSHLIISTQGKDVSIEVIKTFAEICAYYSQGKDSDKIEVDYTKRRYVKKLGGKNLGGVTYENYSTIIVSPNPHVELEIK